MVMHRSSALLLLCTVASITVLAVSYVRGGPTFLVEYSVMPNSPMNYPTPYYPGATDEDQSPAIDPNFEKAVEKSEILYKKLKRILKESDKKEQVIDSKVTKAMNFVSDQVTDINQQVQKINKEDSDKIADVPLIPGPPGLPGINGIDGRNGDDGPTGAQGSRGARGASGVQGPSGPAGVGGFAGDMGPEGPEGRTGGEGPDGFGGMEGQEGPEGSTGSWAHTKFDCMEAATEHMRLVHCNRQGCRLETYFAGRWGTVCDRGFDDNSVGILCKALGFSMGKGVRSKKFGFKKNLAGESSAISSGSEKIWLSSIMCLGGEGDIGDCKHSPWGVANQCTHKNDVGICCFGINDGPLGVRKCKSDFDDCPDAAANWGDTGARLTECDHEGCLLGIKYDKKWGTVCDEGFNDNSAKVVCKSLGFEEGGVAANRVAVGMGPIWLAEIFCDGTEGNLEWCKHGPWGNTKQCDHSMDAGVCCQGKGKPPPKKAPGPKWPCAGMNNRISSGATRLVECTNFGCRLEIKHEDQWGTVCSDDWKEETNARVACSSLGLPGGTSILNYGNRYHKQAGEDVKIWTSNVRCKGDETWVGSCSHDQWGEQECEHDQDVGICCEKAWQKPEMSSTDGSGSAGSNPLIGSS